MRIAVVGAGIAGTACSRVLVGAGHVVTLLDRGRVVGGRLASRRLPDCRTDRYTDIGASYFTVSEEPFRAVVDDWERRGLARPWTDRFHTATAGGLGEVKPGPVRWGAPGGLRSLVEDLAKGLPLQVGTEVRSVHDTTVDGREYDAVVLAMPDPQALRLLDPGSAAAAALAGRAWLPAIAVAAGFAGRTWDPAFDGAFVPGSDVLDWVADDGRRRGDGAAVLVAHTTPAYASRYLAGPPAGGPGVVAAMRALLDLPDPGWTFVQRWTYAKPVGERAAQFWLNDGVGLCGDGWGAPKVEAAWRSGRLLGEALAR